MSPIGIVISVAFAVIAYLILVPLLGLPSILGIVVAIVVLVAGVTSGGFGLGGRLGGGAGGNRGITR